ncbi:DUF6233 domain-containing protein [Streptomyces canus]|uniref:DUF6233 domain-containing protein n=1 Tax=Streptomyces canus TaxID=58343 RepID=UPI00371FB192
MWLQRIDTKIAAVRQREAEHEHGRRRRPPVSDWIVELGIGTGRPPTQLHVGDCYAAGKRRRHVDRDEARRLLPPNCPPAPTAAPTGTRHPRVGTPSVRFFCRRVSCPAGRALKEPSLTFKNVIIDGEWKEGSTANRNGRCQFQNRYASRMNRSTYVQGCSGPWMEGRQGRSYRISMSAQADVANDGDGQKILGDWIRKSWIWR